MTQASDANTSTLLNEMGQVAVGGLEEAVVRFTPIDDFTTFNAEYTLLEESDIVVHFFLPRELQGPEGHPLKPAVHHYWTQLFPSVLDPVARAHFDAEQPRLVAKYSPEVTSWWLRARDYGHILDLRSYLVRFFQSMDQGLDDFLPSLET